LRAWDITILIIAFELAIGFVNGIGLFQTQFFNEAQVASGSNSSSLGFMTGSIDSTGNLVGAQQSGSMDYFTLAVGWLLSGFLLIVSIGQAVVIFLPQLITIFHCPTALAIVIQAMIYLSYVWGYAQWKSGRMGGTIQ
jgi:hypothetical protein